ncbi:hypothetical protein ACVXZY_09600 [Staphylococcus aureus]
MPANLYGKLVILTKPLERLTYQLKIAGHISKEVALEVLRHSGTAHLMAHAIKRLMVMLNLV